MGMQPWSREELDEMDVDQLRMLAAVQLGQQMRFLVDQIIVALENDNLPIIPYFLANLNDLVNPRGKVGLFLRMVADDAGLTMKQAREQANAASDEAERICKESGLWNVYPH